METHSFVKSPVLFDAAFAKNIPSTPGDAAVAFYQNGGDPFHPWPTVDIEKFPHRRKLPVFVRSDPQTAVAEDDAFRALRDLYGLNAFRCFIALDIETAKDAAYVAKWGRITEHYGYRPLVYGSEGNIFALPELHGRWVAAPGKKLSDFHQSQNVRLVQNTGAHPGYDESAMHHFMADSLHWWK